MPEEEEDPPTFLPISLEVSPIVLLFLCNFGLQYKSRWRCLFPLLDLAQSEK